ncbi:glycoside hydrolase family 2 TIM barrel-domain containing protein [Gracilimonas mengyeensis]|uniref:Beta-galactosidase n=1 Tax=Gracilimonas mengyeensis TaxID=1302730 RepID=A0A521BSA7_9BACT|nr:glycoside hydrolase family 2 TIM barrel-domain containing protein [Gracilimonas mengyeensis]SMO50013.1 beta-galactosidase [Gracilimonas mengyeensis]
MKVFSSFFLSIISSLFLFSGVMAFQQQSPDQNLRQVTTLQTGWTFAKSNHPQAKTLDFDDSDWEQVSVPHDWAISGPFIMDGDGSTAKLPWKGQGWYRRTLDIPADLGNKRVYLEFDGVMAFPKIYVNGELAGKWDYGYNSFYLDVTEHLSPGGENLLAVHADTRQHDSRWYPGAGIYRKVQMKIVNPVHVDIWGTYITTPIVKPNYADVRIRTTVENKTQNDADIKVEQIIYSPGGNEVGRGDITPTIKANSEAQPEVTITLTDPQRWDIDNPVLYTAKTLVYNGDELVDSYKTTFGVRTIRFTADNGFYLNDRRVQFKGVNLHHGHGPLGAAFHPRAMERQLQIMKDMGVNAIRTSHNTAAPELLELCDKMGLLFFNEVFDKYDEKAGITDTTDFDSFARRNIRNHVVRDRNHPSLFLWSVGNEIGDVQWNVDNGFQRLNTMVSYTRMYDPTRPVTLVNDQTEGARMRHFDYYDVHSWNYNRRYRIARQMEPNKAVIISESASTVSTRGFYEFPLPDEHTYFTKSLQVSSYDLNAPWWAEIADDDFMWQQQEPYIAGEFVWTGFDYLGEPTPYANNQVQDMGMTDREASRSSYFGIVDLVGIPKDRFYLYKSYWKPQETTIHILPHWNWEDADQDTIPVFVYTNGDCAELFLNGDSQGKQCKNPKSETSVERFRLMWDDVVYEPGELKAVAYKEGVKIGEEIKKTTGEATKLKLTPDRTAITADGMDLSYILVEAFDAEGNAHPLSDERVNISLEGPAQIAGVGNGNPQSFEPFQADYADLFYGKAMIILKSKHQAGKVTVNVSADGFEGDAAEIVVK